MRRRRPGKARDDEDDNDNDDVDDGDKDEDEDGRRSEVSEKAFSKQIQNLLALPFYKTCWH